MGRAENVIKPETLTLSLNAQTLWYLDRLMEKGLFGNGRAEAAKIVLQDHLKLLIGKGELAHAPPLAVGGAIPVNS